MKVSGWVLEAEKFLTGSEAKKLLSTAKYRAELTCLKESTVAVRDYFIVHLGLATGLRVMEIAALKCGDLFLPPDKMCSLLVRKGKGGRKRTVYFKGALQKHCREYLKWKQRMGESIEPEQPLIVSRATGSHMTTRAIQKVFKRCAARAGLSAHYSIHGLRHTYACQLYQSSDYNLRLVQKQLGHAKITTTQVYADVMTPVVEHALDKLHRMNTLI